MPNPFGGQRRPFERVNSLASRTPARQPLEILTGKWVADVLDRLSAGSMRYSELLQEIDGVASSVLTRTLRRMERDGLVVRTVRAAVPPEVEYSVTPLGESLDEPLTALASWAELHFDEVVAARQQYLRRCR